MRKETLNIATAFRAGVPLTAPRTMCNGNVVYLHGNEIVRRNECCYVYTLAGWPTVTTRDRLNGVARVMNHDIHFYQKDGKQYISNAANQACEILDTDKILYNYKTKDFIVQKGDWSCW